MPFAKEDGKLCVPETEMKLSTPSILLPVLVLVLCAGVVRAQDDLRSVQEELRRRSLYFGDVNGRASAELEEATKRYQKRKGFAATGKPDRETLKSLGLVPRSPNEPVPEELSWPAEPVLPSDEKINPVAVAKALHEETGIAPAAVVPKELAGRASLQRKKVAVSDQPAPASVTTSSRSRTSPAIAPTDLSRFVGDYFAAMASSDIKRQVKFYADNVDYYRNGKIDRRIIEQTLRRYQARWPSRRYSMGEAIHYGPINSRGEIVMTFPVAFTLKDGRQTVKGRTQNRLSISAATLDPRISSISEQRIRQ
ncbi:MAG: putative peptidoglycan binding domain [Verrucomicrobiota bacterium]|jgi:peptidoglycan hydrolase-like protein with peptidoglycan-binding domain